MALAALEAGAESVKLRWLGVAGFTVEAGDSVLVLDPYLSRPGLLRCLLHRYRPNPEVLAPLLLPDGPTPELGRAGLILVGHSHFDHLGDVSWIAQQTGARIAGTRTTTAISESYGADPARLLELAPGDETSEGVFDVRAVASEHARILFGKVPLDGVVSEVPEAPRHILSFKMGGAIGYLITHRPSGLRLFVLSSAGLDPEALAGLLADGERLDVLLPAIAGRAEGYAELLVKHLRPRWVVPHHFDNFFVGLDDPDAGTPIDPEDLAAFEAEMQAAAEHEGIDLSIRRLSLFESWSVPAP
ncbi:MAG: MBL fold metallo-hydrolase [Myxococcales bacterium]|nr:MBL fold metallo-hydrolase [Myxococcales bacterium]